LRHAVHAVGSCVEGRALALVGFMGCGKSTVGRLVAEQAGATCRDLDAMIEASCGMAIAELFRSQGEAAFRALEAELLPQALEPGGVAPLGGGTPMADANWEVIRERAVTVWLDAPLATLRARAEAESRPLLDRRSMDEVRALFDSRLSRYREADHRVDATRSPREVAEEVVQLWRR
jgi:shikimate kinase